MRTLLFVIIATCFATAADVSLIAKITTSFEDGGSVKRVHFPAADGGFAVSLDSGTDVERLADGTRFTFQGLRTAACEFRPSPIPRRQLMAPSNYPAYLAAARAFAPEGAVIPEEPEVTEQPLDINDWKSHRIAFDYHLAEDPKRALHRIAVTFITLDTGQQFALVTRARATEFSAAHARAESLIRSWFPVQSAASAN
jgi:hypothetical protein